MTAVYTEFFLMYDMHDDNQRAGSGMASAFLASAAAPATLIHQILPLRLSTVADPFVDRALDSWKNLCQFTPLSTEESFHQHSWDDSVIKWKKDLISSTCSTNKEQTRLKACQAPHSGDWLNVLPI